MRTSSSATARPEDVYDRRAPVREATRAHSRSHGLRQWQSAIKAGLFEFATEFLRRQRDRGTSLRAAGGSFRSSDSAEPDGLRVLDLACGQGGDIAKFLAVGATSLCGLDLSPLSVQAARARYADLCRKRSLSRLPPPFRPVVFEVADMRERTLIARRGLEGAFDLVTCQYALHYAFETPQTALQAVQNIALALAPNRRVPKPPWLRRAFRARTETAAAAAIEHDDDDDWDDDDWDEWPVAAAVVTVANPFLRGSSVRAVNDDDDDHDDSSRRVWRVTETSSTTSSTTSSATSQLYGHGYRFWLEDCVDGAREWSVDARAMRELCDLCELDIVVECTVLDLARGHVGHDRLADHVRAQCARLELPSAAWLERPEATEVRELLRGYDAYVLCRRPRRRIRVDLPRSLSSSSSSSSLSTVERGPPRPASDVPFVFLDEDTVSEAAHFFRRDRGTHRVVSSLDPTGELEDEIQRAVRTRRDRGSFT